MANGVERYISFFFGQLLQPTNAIFLSVNLLYSVLFLIFLFKFKRERTNRLVLSLVAMSVFNALLFLFKIKEPWMLTSGDYRDFVPVSLKILAPGLFPRDCFTNWLQFSHPLGYPLLTATLISLGADPALLPKLYALILSSVVPLVFFRVGRESMGVRESLVAAWISLYLLDVFTVTMVGLPRSFGFLGFSLSLMFLPRTLNSTDPKYPIMHGLSLGLSYLFHPPSFVAAAFLAASISFAYAILRADRLILKRVFVCLAIAGVTILPQLVFTYAHGVEVGPIASNEFIRKNPVVQEGGRHPIPLSPWSHFASFFHPKNVAESYGILPVLMIAGIWALWRSDIQKNGRKIYLHLFILLLIPTLSLLTFMALFLQPQRYMLFLLFPLAYLSSHWLERLLKLSQDARSAWKKRGSSLLLISLVLIIPVHFFYFYSQMSGESGEHYYDLCLWVKSNTAIGDVFSTHPRVADWIRFPGERSVVISDEYGGFAPTYVKVTNDFTSRMNDTLRALYTESEGTLKQYTVKYNVRYYVVVKELYDEDLLSGDELYPYEPYNTHLKHLVGNRTFFAIFSADFLETVFEDSNFVVLKAIKE